nr:hypothetical protein [Morchella crassipes]
MLPPYRGLWWRKFSFLPKTGFPATRVHLTASLPDAEEPSTRCSFTAYADLDPRSPIFLSSISSDITLPWVINQAAHLVSLMTLVTRALGLPRSLALLHLNTMGSPPEYPPHHRWGEGGG